MDARATKDACRSVQEAAARYYDGITVLDIISDRKSGNAWVARRCAMYVAHEVFQIPFNAIAREFDKDHSTVMTACEYVRDHPAMLMAAYEIARSICGENEGYLPPGEYDEFPPEDERAA